MPKLPVKREFWNKLMQMECDIKEMERIAFAYGIEVELEQEDPKQGGETKFVWELAANRPDHLCAENLAYFLRMHMGLEQPRVFSFIGPFEDMRIIVKKNTALIRPHIVGAILRNVTLSEDSFRSFLDLQDKLHQNLCRKRRLVAIGTHDLDTVKGPFIYDARPPQDIKFQALKQTEVLDCVELFNRLDQDLYIKPYLNIIRDSPYYPVVMDSREIVMSLPPIINSTHTQMSAATKNIFIESTATDLQRALASLACLVSGFSGYCEVPFQIELVRIEYEGTNRVEVTPQVSERELITEMKFINGLLGLSLNNEEASKLLYKMGILSTPVGDSQIKSTIPFYRSDILSDCDLAEDVGVGFGYNNIPIQENLEATVGGETRINKLSDMVREEVAMNGFVECVNFALCSVAEQTSMINRPDTEQLVKISNSKSKEFQCCRATLLPALLKTMVANKTSKFPLQLFEVADVVLKRPKTASDGWSEEDGQTFAVNRRNMSALISNIEGSHFDVIHGLLDQVMLKLNVPNKQGVGYHIEASNDPTFFPELQAKIVYKGNQIGVMGIVHPIVLKNHNWEFPTSMIEMDIQELLKDFK